MGGDCPAARGLGGKASKLDEIGVLLALMCRHACEDCDLVRYCCCLFSLLIVFSILQRLCLLERRPMRNNPRSLLRRNWMDQFSAILEKCWHYEINWLRLRFVIMLLL
jgi:hypothetical protein